MGNLATALAATHRDKDAEACYQAALEIWKKSREPESPNVVRCLTGLADLYRSSGRYAEAEPLYEQALAVRRRTLPPDYPDLAASLQKLATLRAELFDQDGALQCLNEAAKILGPHHREDRQASLAFCMLTTTIFLRFNIADQAEEYGRSAVQLARMIEKADSVNLAIALANLAGVLYSRRKDFDEVESLARESLEIRRRALGEDHPKFIDGLNICAGSPTAPWRASW